MCCNFIAIFKILHFAFYANGVLIRHISYSLSLSMLVLNSFISFGCLLLQILCLFSGSGFSKYLHIRVPAEISPQTTKICFTLTLQETVEWLASLQNN